MIELKAPKEFKTDIWFDKHKAVFLAGGITGCPDWQSELVAKLKDSSATLINPRRDDFDTSKPEMSKEQIEWEFEHLAKAHVISFWFPKETLCPITLFELGAHRLHEHMIVGIEPGYQREFDIREQLRLVTSRTGIVTPIVDNLDAISWWLRGKTS